MKYGLPEVGPLERALSLRSLALFHTLNANELAACAQLTQERYIRRGEVLYEEGGPPRSLFLRVDGRVHLEQHGRRLRDFEASDDAGLVELLAGRSHQSRAVADSNALALVIDSAALLDLMEEHFSFFLEIRDALGAEVGRQQRTLGSYHTLSAPLERISADAASKAVNGAAPIRAALDLAETLLALQRTPVFSQVGLAILAALTSEDEDIPLEPGALLWDNGAAPTFLALIADGIVSCVPEQPEHTFRAGPGALLGVDATFGGSPYAYRATAETPVIARRIDVQMLLDLAEDHFELASRMLAHCANEVLRLQSVAATRPDAPPLGSADGESAPAGAS